MVFIPPLAQKLCRTHNHNGENLNVNTLIVSGETWVNGGVRTNSGPIVFNAGVNITGNDSYGIGLRVSKKAVISGYTTISNTLSAHWLNASNRLSCDSDGDICDGKTYSSSRVFKKNIKSYKNFDKSLSYILNTPLFTYQYKKDHPDKTRMGVISEELPNFLQIKDKGAPSRPDWVSIYGTLWAGIKALFHKFSHFQESQEKFKARISAQDKAIESLKTQINQQK